MACCLFRTLMPGHFAGDIFEWIFLNENGCIFLTITPKSVPIWVQMVISDIIGSINVFANYATNHYLNQWWPRYRTHKCVTPSLWVKQCWIIVNWIRRYEFQLNVAEIQNFFVNAFENVVCRMTTNFSGHSVVANFLKISKRFNNWNGCHGRTIFRDIWG